MCLEEIFNYWAYCNACSQNKKEGLKIILCVKCIKIHLKECKNKKKIDLIYKYEEKYMKKFFERIENRIQKNSEFIKKPCLFKNSPQKELIKSKVNFIIIKNSNYSEFQFNREEESSHYSSTSLSLQKARELIPMNKVLKNLLPLIDNYQSYDINETQEDYIDLNKLEKINNEEEEKLKFSPCYTRKVSNPPNCSRAGFFD